MSPYLMKLNHILTIRRLLHWMHVTMQEFILTNKIPPQPTLDIEPWTSEPIHIASSTPGLTLTVNAERLRCPVLQFNVL